MSIINFNSGPSMLPAEILQQGAEGILNLNDRGISVAEISHRSALFENILEEFIALIRELLHLSDQHEVIVMQGGARLQFAQIPMNFLSHQKTAGFIDTGYWAHKAMEYARYYGAAKIIAGSADKAYTYLPKEFGSQKNLGYVQLTSNNTIYGTQFKTLPVFECPVIIDMSSDILSIERDFDHIDFAFACAQKNIGPAGLSIAIAKKLFLNNANPNVPPVFSYSNLIEKKSNYATPPIVSIYMSMLNMRWLKAQGGVKEIQKINEQKAELLYEEIERNILFRSKINAEDRSRMNVCFLGKNENTENGFLDFCNQRNIIGIKGHKAVGGLRASLYNAQTLANVEYLIEVMQEFEKEYLEK